MIRAALALLRANPVVAAIGGALIFGLGVLLWRAPWAEARGARSRDGEVATLTAEKETLIAASFKALAEAQANARRIEAVQTQATEEATRDLHSQLSAARAAALAHADQLRAATRAPAGGSSPAGGAGAAEPAAAVVGAGSLPLMDADDLLICSENTVKARAWPDWWRRIVDIPLLPPIEEDARP